MLGSDSESLGGVFGVSCRRSINRLFVSDLMIGRSSWESYRSINCRWNIILYSLLYKLDGNRYRKIGWLELVVVRVCSMKKDSRI